jgi:hypothetical protein
LRSRGFGLLWVVLQATHHLRPRNLGGKSKSTNSRCATNSYLYYRSKRRRNQQEKRPLQQRDTCGSSWSSNGRFSNRTSPPATCLGWTSVGQQGRGFPKSYCTTAFSISRRRASDTASGRADYSGRRRESSIAGIGHPGVSGLCVGAPPPGSRSPLPSAASLCLRLQRNFVTPGHAFRAPFRSQNGLIALSLIDERLSIARVDRNGHVGDVAQAFGPAAVVRGGV